MRITTSKQSKFSYEFITKELPGHRLMASSYAQSNRVAEAKPHVKAVLDARSNFSVAKFGKALPFKRKHERELYLTALREAGLPDWARNQSCVVRVEE